MAAPAAVRSARQAPYRDQSSATLCRWTRFDRAFIERKLAISLERLGVNSATSYLSHRPDPQTPIERTLEGFAAVVESGRVRHIGCCNVDANQLRNALEASDRLGLPSFEWVQNGFSLLTPEEHREVRAICAERNLGFTPYSPLAGGVLTGKYKRATRSSSASERISILI